MENQDGSLETPKSNPNNLLLGNQKLLRGDILAATVQIERKIDNYLSTYFCGSAKKKNQLDELLFYTEKISLDMKRQIFVNLLKSNNSVFLKENRIFLKTLESIIPHRNVFAHLEVMNIYDLPREDRKNLVFKKYSDGALKPKKYTIDTIVDILVDMEYVNFSLDVILQELPPLA
jgi:hypothetical protein